MCTLVFHGQTVEFSRDKEVSELLKRIQVDGWFQTVRNIDDADPRHQPNPVYRYPDDRGTRILERSP
jgi:hypothetical protein